VQFLTHRKRLLLSFSGVNLNWLQRLRGKIMEGMLKGRYYALQSHTFFYITLAMYS